MKDFLDDDEGVKGMRETADAIGLTDLLIRALHDNNEAQRKELIRQALRLLGATEEGDAQ